MLPGHSVSLSGKRAHMQLVKERLSTVVAARIGHCGMIPGLKSGFGVRELMSTKNKNKNKTNKQTNQPNKQTKNKQNKKKKKKKKCRQ